VQVIQTKEHSVDESLYKDLFLFELERKESLAERGSVLVGGLTVIGGLIAFMVDGHEFDGSSVSSVFTILLAGGLVCFSVSLLYFVLFFRGYTYRALPTLKVLQKCRRDLDAYYSQYPSATGNAEIKFREYLYGLYAETTEVNARNNQIKAAFQARAVSWMIYAAIFFAVAAVPYFIGRKTAPAEIMKVTIIPRAEASR
jgi:hypothetical protein